jgi:hypothetical protein
VTAFSHTQQAAADVAAVSTVSCGGATAAACAGEIVRNKSMCG